MKKNKIKDTFKASVHMLLMLMILVSCDDKLETNPPDQLSSETFWRTIGDANAGLAAIYDGLQGNSRDKLSWSKLGYFDVFTPIGNSRNGGARRIAEGGGTVNEGIFRNFWRAMYKGVVRANDFLDNIDRVSFDIPNGEIEKNRMIGEARFLRAMYYYLLVEQYGDVPLFTSVPGIDDASATRAPKAEVIALIKEDLSFAFANLPEPGAEETGRATKGAAKALEVKIALYEKNWGAAATACETIMAMGYALVPEFEDVISIDNENNEEVIFDVEHVFMTDAEPGGSFEKYYAFRSSAASGWSEIQPTRWLVEQYEVLDPNPTSVNPDPERIPNEVFYFFEGRDPRMDKTILRAGKTFVNQFNTSIVHPHEFSAINHTQTGMHMRKYVIPGPGSANFDSPLDFIIFRYADILLNYLEAVAMRDGINTVSQEILDQTINAIRIRASNTLPLFTSGNITMEDIYHERVVELAMEGWTYFDMKRNGMIEMNDGYVVQGLRIKAGQTIEFNNQVRPPRFFDPNKHYLWPITIDELERGEGLEQNPGYTD
ncbi:MAG: RagB/SusD family nutrient uptake outer membrane protein [Flavobacteriaceae bacterium]|nr:RagB/SusD family nutrient uptake outer membrane protein [Flavobacteriaceae bacterium]